MCEGISSIINGPIPPHPMFNKEDDLISTQRSSNNLLCQGPSKLSGPFVSHFDASNQNQ